MAIHRNPAILLPGILLYAAAIVRAQDAAPLTDPASTNKIEALLSSGDSRLVAWGAHYAITAKSPELSAELLDLAERWQPTPPDPSPDDLDSAELNSAKSNQAIADHSDAYDATAAVLDALIQLHITPEASTLRNLAADFPNQVAILMTRLPEDEAQALSLEFYRLNSGTRPGKHEIKTRGAHNLEYVSAVLLAQHPPAGFAAGIFSSIYTHATITIIKPGYSEAGTYGSGIGQCCGIDSSHHDWPLFGVYQLSADKTEGYFVLIAGADPVYAGRSETRHVLFDGCANFSFLVFGPEERRRFVARWLGKDPDDLAWEIETTDTITFRSNQQVYEELNKFIAHEQEKYRATAAALGARNLMTVSEQEESLPYLDLTFKDQRGAGALPIPEPSSLPAHVSWPKQP
jgi:hypothetical protein